MAHTYTRTAREAQAKIRAVHDELAAMEAASNPLAKYRHGYRAKQAIVELEYLVRTLHRGIDARIAEHFAGVKAPALQSNQ